MTDPQRAIAPVLVTYPPRGGPATVVFTVSDSSEVGAARRGIDALASAIGLDESVRGTIALLVTELATNLARHARDGRLWVRGLAGADEPIGIEIVSVDAGPGMSNVPGFLRDGFSTAGTAGKGLGAVQRLADEFDIYSIPGAGTVIVARTWGRGAESRPRLAMGVVCLPLGGAAACGDAWRIREHEGETTVVIADGLGHGVEAAAAADAAIETFERTWRNGIPDILRAMHAALRPTRGAAVSVARLDGGARNIRFAGVGNVAGSLLSVDGSRGLVSSPGIVGHQMARVHEMTYPWPVGSTLVMHSDGVSARWALDRYPAFTAQRPSVIAATLARDHARTQDDATIVAIADRTVVAGAAA